MDRNRSTNLGMVGPVRWIVEAKAITTHFQPIFSIPQRSVVGMEALARGVAGPGYLIPPLQLFKMAAAERLMREIEELCRWNAARLFTRIPNDSQDILLFLNLDLAASPSHEAVLGELEALVRACELEPRHVAVEFLESRLDDVGRFGALATALRKRGFLVVLDDVGAGHSNLDRIPLFRPDIIKIDRSLVTGIESDFYKQETFKSLANLSRRIGALVVAEGVETEAEAVTSLTLGADLLQGFLLCRPQDVSTFEGDGMARTVARASELAEAFKSHQVGQINDRRVRYRRVEGILSRMLADLSRIGVDQYSALLARVVGEDPKVECCYVLDEAGLQVTETIGSASLARRSGAAMFRPAPRGTDHSLKEYFYVLMDAELPKYTTDPYVSLASGNLCRTISTRFRDHSEGRTYVLCVDVSP
jgi:EAL domain-containing protein (putative c-di-GMP-specific phosphodiesterase class I)